MKKILFLLIAVMQLYATAQNAVGDWRIHTSYVGNDVKTVAESRQWVYYLTGSYLFRLDKDTQENESLCKINDLSDMNISQIYYNSDKDYLVVVYSNSNIDIIKGDGAVVNMPEVKDAVMTSSKVINDVTFSNGLIYLATDFGYVMIDDVKTIVKESHIFNKPLVSVAQVGELLLLSSADAFYYGKAGVYHEQLSSFSQADFEKKCRIRPIDDKSFFCINDSTLLCNVTTNGMDVANFLSNKIIDANATVVQKTKGGYLLNVPSARKCFKTDEQGMIIEVIDTHGEIYSRHPENDDNFWAAGAQGLHEMGDDNYYMPNALSFAVPFWMTYNKSKDLLYVSSPAANVLVPRSATRVNTYDGMTWTDVTPDGAPHNGSYWIEFMPGDPDTYFLGTWTDGLLKVVNNEIALVYDTLNSPMIQKYALHPITTVDRNGNVWVVQSYENPEHPVMVLPAAKAKQNQVTVADWLTPVIDGTYTGHTPRAMIMSTRNSNYDIKIFSDGDFEAPVVFWNSNGEISSRPPQVSYDRFTDQDGQVYSWTNVMCFTEDLNGLVWMGSTEGVISFNPAQAFSNDFRVNHIKVPRNDGTGMADYLMSGIQVNDIAVDGANRKWLATQTSGLFLVSADGTQIIRRFNTTNSPLASNTVYRVCCNPNSNSVYITTPAGLYEYFSDSSPAENNYDNIYAYPNPVRPDYSGEVTIKGLMDNSLVKIADASGNVIRQFKSTGGMATWDCCDQNGDRAQTGVYLVICSQANGGSEAVVTKIAVIR